MIDIILVTDKEIKRLNREWFGEKRATDVIAFDHGEIYISIDTAGRQAKERGVNFTQEVLRLAVHGTVHIAGFNDTNLKDFCRMREREWKLLIGCMSSWA
ncbi:MAG: rRNA maturation RNase YbeY [Deltaproteobacteria bacterium CG11_big_fil_rev_8_21_14_0_20_49_13]|nr:MAG: rRNA maturation RNase YbeY [Deltaproteobacteria bacterium CG11_big_fil_rev_8_21_14_0_20_49_13]